MGCLPFGFFGVGTSADSAQAHIRTATSNRRMQLH
jgi:hypothetical protein